MRSDNAKAGMQQAPARSLFRALGLTDEEMERPLIGIVSSYNEIVPGHMNLDKIVNAVKQGVAMAGGTPVVFPAIAVHLIQQIFKHLHSLIHNLRLFHVKTYKLQ